MKIPELIKELMDKGISISLLLDKGGDILFDINTGAKSHLHLKYNEDSDSFIGYRRYGDVVTDIHSVDDLIWEVHDCMLGRDSVNQAWMNLMVEKGIFKKVEKVEYEYVKSKKYGEF